MLQNSAKEEARWPAAQVESEDTYWWCEGCSELLNLKFLLAKSCLWVKGLSSKEEEEEKKKNFFKKQTE